MAQDTDVTIFIEGQEGAYNLRYELNITLATEVTEAIERRMLKSFSLGQRYDDASTVKIARQKAALMQRIFLNEYGFSSIVIELFAQ